MSDSHATGSPAANCTFQPDCPCGEFPCDIGKDATPERAAIAVKVYPVEHRAAIDAVGSPESE